MAERDFCGYPFAYVDQIRPKRSADGRLVESAPQDRYRNSRGLLLHRYGDGVFCCFHISDCSGGEGVYLLLLNGVVVYVGKCENLRERFNAGYGNISPRNCYEHGQQTNCRINRLIEPCAEVGDVVELWFHKTAERKSAESTLIQLLRPEWNLSRR